MENLKSELKNKTLRELEIELINIERELIKLNLKPTPMGKFDFQEYSIYKNNIVNLKNTYNSIIEIFITKPVDISHFFFEYSSFNNYKNRFNDLLNDFKKNYVDSNLSEFIKDQKIGYERVVPTNLLGYNDKITLTTKSKIEYSIKRKVEYLEELLTNEYSKDLVKNKNPVKPYPKYCEIGSLFAQGFISKDGFDYFYKEISFDDASKLSKYLKKEILKTDTSVRQYIDGTLKKQTKDFYKSKKMMKNIIEYCKSNNIEITPRFQSKYNDLINLH